MQFLFQRDTVKKKTQIQTDKDRYSQELPTDNFHKFTDMEGWPRQPLRQKRDVLFPGVV
jgi:hypothetical protein